MKVDFLQHETTRQEQTERPKQTTRRAMFRDSAARAGSAFLPHVLPGALMRASAAVYGQQAAAPAVDRVANLRAQMGAAPIQAQKLTDNLTLLSGPGGNVVVLNGPDGKFVVDTFLSPAWPKLKATLDALGNAPVKLVIDTPCHSNHTATIPPFTATAAPIPPPA